MAKTKILIVDNHKMVRKTLAQLIDQEKDLEVCGEAENAREALKKIHVLKPDVAILDLVLGDMKGLDLIQLIKSRWGRTPAVLVVSMHDQNVHAAPAIKAGARGYLMKMHSAEKVVDAIRAITKGEIYTSRPAAKASHKPTRRVRGKEIKNA